MNWLRKIILKITGVGELIEIAKRTDARIEKLESCVKKTDRLGSHYIDTAHVDR